MEEAEGKRLLNLKVAAMQEAAGLYKAELKYTDAKGKKYRRWFLMMPRGADGTLALDKPRFAPKDQVKLVNELDKHWDDLRDYSDMNIRRCSVKSQNMSEITEVLDALDAVFRDTDVPLAKPQEVETVINDLIAAGKYQPPATAASPSNAKRGRRSSSPPEGRTEGASDEAEEGQTPGPGGELPHVPPPPPPFPSSWPLPVTHPAAPLARATKTSHLPWAPQKPGPSVSSLQLSEGLREDVPVEVRRRPVVTLQGAADAERVVNSLGKNGGRFAVEVQGLSVLLLLCRGPAQQPRHPYRFHAIILRPGCGRRLRPIRRRFR